MYFSESFFFFVVRNIFSSWGQFKSHILGLSESFTVHICPVFMIITVMINLMRQIWYMKGVNGRFDHSKGGSIYLFFAKMICPRQTVRMTATSDLLLTPVW